MSLNAASLRAMAEKGLTAFDIAEIAEAMEVRRDSTAAERQQRHRDRMKAERDDVTRDVTRDDVTAAPSPDKSPPDPQKLTPNPTGVDISRPRKAGVFPCPEGVDPQHWADFLANRKTKRLTNTPTAYRQQLKALAELTDDDWPPGRIVEFVAGAGWGAIHDPRSSYRNTSNGHSKPGARSSPDGLGVTARAANRAFGPLPPEASACEPG